MLTRRDVLTALAILAATSPSLAAEDSARDFLAAIYSNYQGKDAKGVNISDKGAPGRYFTPSLARLIENDAARAAKRKQVGTLDGDPFVDAQDFEITDVKIDVKDTGPAKATGTVTFKNFGKDVTVTLDLRRLKKGWRIDDIQMPSGSLRAMFKKA